MLKEILSKIHGNQLVLVNIFEIVFWSASEIFPYEWIKVYTNTKLNMDYVLVLVI